MQIEIIESVKTKKIIDVEFPYYFIHDCSGDSYNSIWYGKIDGNRVFKIKHGECYVSDDVDYEVEIEDFGPSFHCYFKDEYQSNEEEFNKAKEKLIYELLMIDQQKSLQDAGYRSAAQLLNDIAKHKQQYRQRFLNSNLVIRTNSTSRVTSPEDVFKKLWYEKTRYSEKDRDATYEGFLMAIDYFGEKS